MGMQRPRLPGPSLLLRPGWSLLPYLARHGCEQMGGGGWRLGGASPCQPLDDLTLRKMGLGGGPPGDGAEQECCWGCPACSMLQACRAVPYLPSRELTTTRWGCLAEPSLPSLQG